MSVCKIIYFESVKVCEITHWWRNRIKTPPKSHHDMAEMWRLMVTIKMSWGLQLYTLAYILTQIALVKIHVIG